MKVSVSQSRYDIGGITQLTCALILGKINRNQSAGEGRGYFLKRSVFICKSFYELYKNNPTNKFLLAVILAGNGVAQTYIHTNKTESLTVLGFLCTDHENFI